MYNLINNQNEQQSNGFAINEKERGLSGVFSALMRKVYTWMTLALVITGVTAYGVAASPTLMMTLMTSRGLLFGLVIAELALVFIITGALNRLSLSTATLNAGHRVNHEDGREHRTIQYRVDDEEQGSRT